MAYIDKEPIVNFITKGLNNPDKTKAYGYDAIEILTEIEYAPTADVVEVKHGEWEDLYKGKYDNPLYTCSECYCRALYKPETDELGRRVFKQELSKVCPHCFAKMDGGDAE